MLTRREVLKAATCTGAVIALPIAFFAKRTVSASDPQSLEHTLANQKASATTMAEKDHNANSEEKHLKAALWTVIAAIEASGELSNTRDLIATTLDLEERISKYTDSPEVRKRALVYFCVCGQCREERLALIEKGAYD